VNVRGAFDVTKAFIGEMLARGAGVIVNIASIGGVVGIPDRLADYYPTIGRIGKPEEIAVPALYLVSDEAAFITGTALIIDGGWSAG